MNNSMYIYLLPLAGFAILFILSHGFFRKSAAFLLTHLRLPLHIDEDTLSVSLVIVFISLMTACGVTFAEKATDTVAMGYIEKGDYGDSSYIEDVTVEADGTRYDISLNVPSIKYSDTEVENYLSDAESKLLTYVCNGIDKAHVDTDLSFITSLPENPVSISWITYEPELLDYDGSLGESIPETGSKVHAEATLSLQEKTKVLTYEFTVYPRLLDSRTEMISEISSAVEASDTADDARLTLPVKIKDLSLKWYSKAGNTGYILLFIGIAFAVLFPMIKLQNTAKEKKRRRESMLMDYPEIIDKIVLLTNAGAGMRSVFKRISLDYTREFHVQNISGKNTRLRQSKEPRYGYEEIVKVYNEMNLGVSETEAYRHLGERCNISQYKSLSALLVQNLRRGSRQLLTLLEEEAERAFEERKKKARILGEEAGTKLLFPMLMMLGIVMIILVVPAFLTLTY